MMTRKMFPENYDVAGRLTFDLLDMKCHHCILLNICVTCCHNQFTNQVKVADDASVPELF